jgi:DNA-binding MarR family transcriptional regulator
MNLIRYQLTPEELLVYEYTIGAGGKPKLRPGEIATKLGMHPTKVSRLRNSITKKIESFS